MGCRFSVGRMSRDASEDDEGGRLRCFSVFVLGPHHVMLPLVFKWDTPLLARYGSEFYPQSFKIIFRIVFCDFRFILVFDLSFKPMFCLEL